MSPYGPRHFAATQQLGRFRSEADIERFSVCTERVAFDPYATCVMRASYEPNWRNAILWNVLRAKDYCALIFASRIIWP